MSDKELCNCKNRVLVRDTTKSLGDQCPPYSNIKTSVAEFNKRISDVTDEHRPGRPISVNTPVNTDSVHNKFLGNRPIGPESIAGALHISYDRCFR